MTENSLAAVQWKEVAYRTEATQ